MIQNSRTFPAVRTEQKMYRPVVQVGLGLQIRVDHLAYRGGSICPTISWRWSSSGHWTTWELLQTCSPTLFPQPVHETGHLG